MRRHPAHIERIDPEDYTTLYDERLPRDTLVEHQPLSLLVRSNDELFEAYRLTATIEQLRRGIGKVAFRTVMLNRDFMPASSRIRSDMDEANNWHAPTFAIEDNGLIVPTPQGFFVARQADAFDYLLLESRAEQEAESRSAA